MDAFPDWAGPSMVAHMAFALVLGWSVGYERHFSGRAAGSQVYCLVCATSCAVTLLGGYPSLWYWGTAHASRGGDPTNVIGSILTGIGFLGAGIIVKSGLNVRGLTTAASIWGSSVIGILVGVGFYLPAISLTALFIISVAVVPRIESRLPARAAIAATLRFRAGYEPRTEAIHRFLAERGLSIAQDSLTITHDGARIELQCMIIANTVVRSEAMNRIAVEMAAMADVESYTITHSSRG
ncbi:MgtC/SapB family protein [Variovorax guangxiensis]|uniref:MgtC/SapB family protein n=1 Tax=Variovorax guangxiensis TaxID=1775474 RepID=UPI002854CC23|nr:MgtC/SapB family protein [Variovorax guangxiensis]MDR6858526.1 putative Mg2+ transporter-C (MgtC) family protein [Variovorax guangxiensis]